MKKLMIHFICVDSALQINIIPLPVTVNRKIKKPPIKLNFWQSQ